MATNRFWLKIQNLEVPSRIYSNKIRLSLLATPKWPQMTKNTDFRWVCYPSHILFWANLCITRWKLIDFAKKSKIRRFRPTFIAMGAHKGFCSLRLTWGVNKSDFFRFYTSGVLGTSNSSVLYPFFWILEPHSKFKRPKSIFSEIPRVQPLIPIIACRSAKMAAKHLRGIP